MNASLPLFIRRLRFAREIHLNIHFLYPCAMDELLANMLKNLSENEATTLFIDPSKLSAPPTNALVGRLAMKKHTTVAEVETSLRIIWEVGTSMKVTVLGDNLYMFSFKDGRACDWIFQKQPWHYRGSLLLLDRMRVNECPPDLSIQTAPMWIQIHGLQFRAMNERLVGERIGALFGRVLEVCSGAECIRVRALINVHNPILRWTNVTIGGITQKIFFRYEKLADFCLFCGRLDHLENSCEYVNRYGLRLCGPWLRANGQLPTSMDEIVAELNRANPHASMYLTDFRARTLIPDSSSKNDTDKAEAGTSQPRRAT